LPDPRSWHVQYVAMLGCRGALATVLLMAVAAASAGCLSGGPPPAGTNLLAGRPVVTLQFLTPGPLGEARLLVAEARPGAADPNSLEQGSRDLHLLTLPAAGGSPGDRLLGERVIQATQAQDRLILSQVAAEGTS